MLLNLWFGNKKFEETNFGESRFCWPWWQQRHPTTRGSQLRGFLGGQWTKAAVAISSSGQFTACFRVVPASLDSTVLVCVDSSAKFHELPNVLIIKSFSG